MPLPSDLVALGEIGLAGEVRQVSNVPRRLEEAARVGFTRRWSRRRHRLGPPGIELVRVDTLAQAVSRLGLVADDPGGEARRAGPGSTRRVRFARERASEPALSEALAMVAPGRPLRDGLDRIVKADRGALVVVGDDPAVLSICSGGFLLDAEFSPQRLSELAKMDGAIILAPDASRIARANVHLMPKASIPTTETGTRHRTAERVARSVDVPVLRCRPPCR